MTAYYNEFDPYAAQWLRNLMAAGHIAPGVVDERSIEEVSADDLKGFTQCHFFAGIGGWSLAARLAGWPDDRPLWTGSCPCQPFSGAGNRKGTSDERHLWPVFFRLIKECRPPAVVGEQVASRLGREWFSGVRADLETLAYAVGGADLCAASVGAPHIRQRLWFVGLADASSQHLRRGSGQGDGTQSAAEGEAWERQRRGDDPRSGRADDGMADAQCPTIRERGSDESTERTLPQEIREQWFWADVESAGRAGRCQPSWMADADEFGQTGQQEGRREAGSELAGGNIWLGKWIDCADGKARRIEPSIEPLAHGVSNRVGRLRAYGNAIVPQVAAEVLKAFMASEF